MGKPSIAMHSLISKMADVTVVHIVDTDVERPVKHVLVVDDDVDIRDLVFDVLTREGYRVERSPSGEDCLARLDNGESPGLILLDIMMDGIDGWETLKRIKSNPSYSNIAVSMLTVIPLTPSDMKREGVTSLENYVIKPFDVDYLIKKVSDIFGMAEHIQRVKTELSEKGKTEAAKEYERCAKIVARHQKLSRILKACNIGIEPGQVSRLKEVLEMENLLIRINQSKLQRLEKEHGLTRSNELKEDAGSMLYA